MSGRGRAHTVAGLCSICKRTAVISKEKQQALQEFIKVKLNSTEWIQLKIISRYDAESLASDISNDARFAKIGLCGFWYGPTETEIRDILSLLSVYTPYGPDVAMVSAAVALACKKCRHRANFIAWLLNW